MKLSCLSEWKKDLDVILKVYLITHLMCRWFHANLWELSRLPYSRTQALILCKKEEFSKDFLLKKLNVKITTIFYDINQLQTTSFYNFSLPFNVVLFLCFINGKIKVDEEEKEEIKEVIWFCYHICKRLLITFSHVVSCKYLHRKFNTFERENCHLYVQQAMDLYIYIICCEETVKKISE